MKLAVVGFTSKRRNPGIGRPAALDNAAVVADCSGRIEKAQRVAVAISSVRRTGAASG